LADRQRGLLFAVSASLMFGLSPVFAQLTLSFVNVETMNVLLTAFASLCFVVPFAAFNRSHLRCLLENWSKVALVSLLSAAGSMIFTYGIFLYGAVNAAFLIQFTAVFTILFGVVFFMERFTRLEAAGILLAVVGVFVLAYGDLSLELVGSAVLLGAALLFASANSLSKVYVKEVNPVALAGGNSMFMLVFIFAFAFLTGRLETAVPSEALLYAFLGSITGVVLSFALFFKALKILELSRAATIRTMEPFLTAIFSFAILTLPPTVNQLAGGALIMVGVVVLSLSKGK